MTGVGSRSRERTYSIEAIPLKRMDYGEADRIVTVLSHRQGKLRLLAKGARKPGSRMAGHLEPFSITHIMVAKGRDLDLATQASTIESNRLVREDLLKASFASHLCELVDAFLEDRDEHTDVFRLLREALAGLAAEAVTPDLIARSFEMHLLGAVGFRPQLDVCLKCRREITPGGNGYSINLGGAVCPGCTDSEPSTKPIQDDSLKLMRFLQRTTGFGNVGIRAPLVVTRDVEALLRAHLEFALERRLRAADFVRHVSETIASYAR